MYCACFSVGKMCDEVSTFLFRRAFARPAKTTMTIWIDLRLSMRL